MTQPKDAKAQPAPCTCMKDAFAALPPELRPRERKESGLRQVTCPGCGLVYWTNRTTDLCMECEKDARPPQSTGTEQRDG